MSTTYYDVIHNVNTVNYSLSISALFKMYFNSGK